MNKDLNSGKNMWILKPSGYNRGIGIHVFSTLEQLEKLIIEYCNGVEEKITPSKSSKINKI